MSKIDITSTALEKGIESANEFLTKLVGPAIEELGLLIKDRLTFWRFRNQVKMINKAQKYCASNNIDPKNIPLKILYPIMEYSALEESDKLQDKWAILLSNMVDSEQNIENHVFPYILSQISTKEFQIVDSIVSKRFKERKYLNVQLTIELTSTSSEREELQAKINKKQQELKNLPESMPWSEKYEYKKELMNIQGELSRLNAISEKLKMKINAPIVIPENELEEFEFSNLRRLGIIKGISKQVASLQDSDISLDIENESVTLDDITIEIKHEYEEFIVTQLGELFIDVCTEKKEKST